jgi:hypothetical protein
MNVGVHVPICFVLNVSMSWNDESIGLRGEEGER